MLTTTKTVKDGKRQFDKQWGSRPLERQLEIFCSDAKISRGHPQSPKMKVSTPSLSKSEIAKVLADVPTDPATVAKSWNRYPLDARSALGTLYPEKIERYDKAIDILEKWLKDFPNNAHEPLTFYQLYFAYMLKGNRVQSQLLYADLLKSKYNGNPYSLCFSDPQHIKNMMAKSDGVDPLLSNTRVFVTRQLCCNIDMSYKSDSLFEIKPISTDCHD